MDQPSIGRIVLVKHKTPVNGQHESAAIITQVWRDDVVNLMVLPGAGQPYSMPEVPHEDSKAGGEERWRWPPRVPPRSK